MGYEYIKSPLTFIYLKVVFFVAKGIEPRVFSLLGKCSTSKYTFSYLFNFICVRVFCLRVFVCTMCL